MQRSNLQFCKTASTNFYEFLGMGAMKTESNTKQISRKKIVKKQDLKKKKLSRLFNTKNTYTLQNRKLDTNHFIYCFATGTREIIIQL